MKRLIHRLVLALCILNVVTLSHGAHKIMRIERNTDDLREILPLLPYASQGSGPIIYIFEHSECTPCKKFHLTFSGRDLGVELRHILFAEDVLSANAAAALAMSRKFTDYQALMERDLIPPSYKSSKETRAGLDSIMDPLRDAVLPIMKNNGWPFHGMEEPPIFIWEQLGVLFIESGYNVDRFVLIMKSTKLSLDDVPKNEILLMDGLPLELPPLVEPGAEAQDPLTAPGPEPQELPADSMDQIYPAE